jgi:methylthioribose-1-phosphate isomerase
MNVNGKPFRSIWADASGHSVHIIDQTRLPFSFVTCELSSRDQVAHAISSMQVRGAPLIGVAAAFGVALAMQADGSDATLEESIAVLQVTRPTAVNLAWALAAMRAHLQPLAPAARTESAWAFANKLADEDVATNEAIGLHGMKILQARQQQLGRTLNVLTHCNAGWMATVDWGTALAVIYKAHAAGVPLHVWVDETRPRNQGLLTAWELRGHGVPHTYIVDNAGGHLMQHGKVDLVLVGADRVSRTGDVANKIGTYLKALAAHDNDIPFYAALPVSTIDPTLNDALAEIEIEERAEMEVRAVIGLQGKNGLEAAPVFILDAKSAVSNPGFDITPSRLVTGIITERGVFAPEQLAAGLAA